MKTKRPGTFKDRRSRSSAGAATDPMCRGPAVRTRRRMLQLPILAKGCQPQGCRLEFSPWSQTKNRELDANNQLTESLGPHGSGLSS